VGADAEDDEDGGKRRRMAAASTSSSPTQAMETDAAPVRRVSSANWVDRAVSPRLPRCCTLPCAHQPQPHKKRPLEDAADTPHTSAGRKGKKRRPSSAARKESTAGARSDRYAALVFGAAMGRAAH